LCLWEITQILEKVDKNGLRFTLAGAIASVRGTLPQVMLAMSKTPGEIETDRSRPKGSAEDTDSSGDEGKSQSSSRKAKTLKGKGSAVPYQGGEVMEMLQSMKVLLSHLGGTRKVGRDKKGGGGGGGPGRGKKGVSFKKDPKYYDPSTKMLRFLIGGNPKSNKTCSKVTARKKCAALCAFRH